MKKLLTVIIMIALLTLAACGGSGDKIADVSIADPDGDSESEGAISESGEPEGADVEVTIEEQVVYDANDVKVTVKDIDFDGFFGVELGVLVENNGSKDVTVAQDNMVVNGYMVSGSLYTEVTAGNKANDEISIYNDDLETAGIDVMTDITVYLRLVDPSTYQVIDRPDPVTIQTSAAGSYTQEYDDSGEVVLDKDGVKIVVKDIGDDSIFGPGVRMYMYNGSDKNVTVSNDSISVNGFMLTGWLYTEMVPGAHAVDSLTLIQSDLDDNDIEKIETVEFVLKVFESDTFKDITKTDTIKLNAE